MESAKRELPLSNEPIFKKTKVMELEQSESVANRGPCVVLNPADCDIDFNVEGNGLQGSALYDEGFAYCWSGARANMGITGGKYCFGCRIVSAQPVHMEDTPIDQQHVCRVGISRGDDPVRNLGETLHSFGFGGTGKFSNSGIFSDYGEMFGVGDTIICAVDLENKHMASISFSKNGKWLGVAKHFYADLPSLAMVDSPHPKPQWSSALFPHVLLKNVIVQLQFSIDDGLVPVEGYRPWAAASLDGKTVLGPSFLKEEDCEVIMMVGLPASGKSTWGEKWVKEHPEKRYVILGTNLALEQMKVPGLLRKHNYGERFDRLINRATKIFNVLVSRASKIRRNFIIDQTNVYKSARKRKLKPFANYIKIAAVVFPRPEELKFRADKRFREMGKEVPADDVKEMLANYTFPMSKDMPKADEYFDKVWFVELNREEAQRCLDDMKSEICVQPSVAPSSCEGSQKARLDSYICPSFQGQGAGDQFLNSYTSQPIPRAPSGSYDSNYIGGVSGYDFTRINSPLGSALPAFGGPAEVYRRYGTEDAPIHPGVESRQFLHGVNPGLNQRNIPDPYSGTSSLSPIRYDGGYTIGSGGMTCDPSAVRHPGQQSGPPFAFGSSENQILQPPYGMLPHDVQNSTVRPPNPSPPNLRPPPMYVQRPGFYPPPPRGY